MLQWAYFLIFIKKKKIIEFRFKKNNQTKNPNPVKHPAKTQQKCALDLKFLIPV